MDAGGEVDAGTAEFAAFDEVIATFLEERRPAPVNEPRRREEREEFLLLTHPHPHRRPRPSSPRLRDETAGQIALDVGFAHRSHMARTMRRVLGVTPAAIRRGRIS